MMSEEGSTTAGQESQANDIGIKPEPLPGSKPSSDPLTEITQLLTGDEDGQEGPEGQSGEDADSSDILPLQGGDGADAEGADAGDAPEEQRSGAERLADLVKELGTSFETVYKDMKVPMANGREVSLGELKDNYQSREALLSEVVESREALEQQRADNLRERQTIEMLLPHVAEVPQETQAQVKQQYEAALARETTALQAALPQLKDQAGMGAFRDSFVEYMGQFGFKPQELTIADHRLILALNKGMELERQFNTMRDKLKPASKPTKRAAKPVDKPTQRRASNDKSDQLSEVMRLLGG